MAGVTVTPIVALDVASSADAMRIVDELGDLCGFYKIGSELFTAAGSDVVRQVKARGARVFLDLKFHDIPNTVRGAARSGATSGADLMTVHASGGREMIEAAVAGVRDSGRACGILAVTVLTSLDSDSLAGIWGRPVADMGLEVLRLAGVAADAGAAGVVCSGEEAGMVRERFNGRLATLVPGIRLPGGDKQDQARVVTPAQAAAAGARYIVLGRAVTGAKSRRDAMSAVLADLP